MISSSIKILQANVNQSCLATESLLQLAIESKVDLILVQEPWIFNWEETFEEAFSTSYLSFTSILPKNLEYRPRTLAYIAKSFLPQVSLALSLPNNPDIQVLDIVQGNQKLQIVNIYNELDQGEIGPRTID